jgi:transposase-like protein
MKVFNDLKDRDVADILIVVTDGFEGHAEALGAAIRPTYTEPSTEAALPKLGAFAQGLWGVKFPTVAAAWRRA